jgi:hypothetical protein
MSVSFDFGLGDSITVSDERFEQIKNQFLPKCPEKIPDIDASNMPDCIFKYLWPILCSNDWSWLGMASAFKSKFNDDDIKEFIYFLK